MSRLIVLRQRRAMLGLVLALPLALVLVLLWATGMPAPLAASVPPESPAFYATYSALAAGAAHSCGLTGDGRVQCWGSNAYGQLGDGSKNYAFLPVDVSGLGNSVSAIAAGERHTCALTQGDDRVFCWGDNTVGQLGDGTTSQHLTPISVSLSLGADYVVGLSAGAYHTCALLHSGTAMCWGLNGFGQLGSATAGVSSTLPVSVSGLVSVTALTAGSVHTCALVAGGAAKCWGDDTLGELGNGAAGLTSTLPVTVSGIVSGATSIAAGGGHTCAIVGGAARCWGQNNRGQLGTGTATAFISVPVGVSGLTSGVMTITAGGAHACALAGSGVKCWGWDMYGQLGNGTTAYSVTMPVSVVGLISGTTALAAGSAHTCALVAGGGAKCWGLDGLGDGGDVESPTPVVVGGPSGLPVTSLALGESHTCAVVNGGVKCWGNNFSGQLGNDAQFYSDVPTNVVGINAEVTAVTAGDFHTCALTRGGDVKCWGANDHYQLGTESVLSSSLPLQVLSGAVAVSAGRYYTCAVLNDGSMQCWGANDSGQLGNGTIGNPRAQPLPVSGLSGVTALATGWYHACAVLAGGAAECWGADRSGQLGNGQTTNVITRPVGVIGLGSGVSLISAGADHTCAVRSGLAKCWGGNDAGQLGSGWFSISETVPITVVDLGGPATNIAAGYSSSCAVVAGAAKCWGDNGSGQLGDGTYGNSRDYPLLVQGLTSGVSGVATGGGHACAQAGPAAVYCWGLNGSGELGDGDGEPKSAVPVGVSGMCNCANPACCIVDLLFSCAPPAGAAQALVARAADAAQPFDIGTFYRVRNDVLATTPAGQRYTNLYYANDGDIRTALLTHPALWTEGLSVLQQFQPILSALVNKQGQSVTITAQEVQAVKTFLNDLSANGSPALQQAIATEEARTPLDPLAGKTVEQARAALVGYPTLYLPLIER